MTNFIDTWTNEGILRPDLAGFYVSDDLPEDGYCPRRDIVIDSAFELLGGCYGFVLSGANHTLPSRRFFVQVTDVEREGEQVSFAMVELEELGLGDAAESLIKRVLATPVFRIAQELNSKAVGLRRTDILRNVDSSESLVDFCELMDIWEVPDGPTTLRFSLGEDRRSQFTLTVHYSFAGGGRWESHLLEFLPQEQFGLLDRFIGNIGWFLRKEHSMVTCSVLRPEYHGEISSVLSGIPSGIQIAQAGHASDGVLWLFLFFKDEAGNNCRVWAEIRDVMIGRESNYSLSLHQDTVLLASGLELQAADVFAYIHRLRSYQELVRTSWDSRDDLVGIHETATLTAWDVDGQPSNVEVSVTVTEAREGPENKVFIVFRQERPDTLPKDFVCEAVLHRSPRDSFDQRLIVPQGLSPRDPVVPLLKRALTRLHCAIYRGGERKRATRRDEFESLEIIVPVPEEPSSSIRLSTSTCWQFGPREFDLMVELTNDRGDYLRTIASFSRFQRTESGYSFHVHTVGMENIEGSVAALQQLGKHLAMDIAEREDSE